MINIFKKIYNFLVLKKETPILEQVPSSMPTSITWEQAFNHPNNVFNLPDKCPCGRGMKKYVELDYQGVEDEFIPMVLTNECQCNKHWYVCAR